METSIRVQSALTPADVVAAEAVLAAAAAEDGQHAVSEPGRLRLKADSRRSGVRHLLQTANGEPAGYAQVEMDPDGTPTTPATAELAVIPALRTRGLGRRLLDATVSAAEGRPVHVWAHGGHPAARRLAITGGAEVVRELRQMRRTAEAPEQPPYPAGVSVRTFRPGVDDEAWLRLNALAFADHPEQGSWTVRDLADRMAEPWFDPAGFFLATRQNQPQSQPQAGRLGERLVGFHWTKVHPDGLGEVYVVGVDPAEQGNGLGRALTATGVRHLVLERGARTVLLYVDAANGAAVRVYERMGFTVHEVDLMYRFPGRKAGS